MYSNFSPALRSRLRNWTAAYGRGMFVALVTAAWLVVDKLPQVPICSLNRIFGIECPACGTTRAIWAILHGELHKAFCLNPAGYVVIAFITRLIFADLLPMGSIRRIINSRSVDLLMIIALIGSMMLKTAQTFMVS